VVLAEAALRNMVGSEAVMRDQVRHILAMSELPHVRLQVIPADSRVAASGPFTIYRFPERELPDVICLEQLTGAIYLSRGNDVFFHYQLLMDKLSLRAEPPESSVGFLRQFFA
jgi:hypothetical protein